jgi:hypothetical protein
MSYHGTFSNWFYCAEYLTIPTIVVVLLIIIVTGQASIHSYKEVVKTAAVEFGPFLLALTQPSTIR